MIKQSKSYGRKAAIFVLITLYANSFTRVYLLNNLSNNVKEKHQENRERSYRPNASLKIVPNVTKKIQEKKERYQPIKEQKEMISVNDGIWIGRHYDEDRVDPHAKDIHIVISYCANDIAWISDFINGYNISSIHIISKCGYPIENAPAGSTIEVLPNVGRNDHSYAYYINFVLDSKMAESGSEVDNSVVVFLKDNINNHQPPHVWSTFDDLVTYAASSRGFGCLLVPGKSGRLRFYSAYHNSTYLHYFEMSNYNNNEGYTPEGSNETEFKSRYINLGHMMTSLNIKTQPIVQVCYGGLFSASVSNIKKTNETIWKDVEKALSRGDSIEEGHFIERYWGNLLSTPLTEFETRVILNHADTVLTESFCYSGALLTGQGNRTRLDAGKLIQLVK